MLISKCQKFYTKEQDGQRHLKLEDYLDPWICLATKKINSLKPIEASNNRHNFLKNVTLNSHHEYFSIHRRSSHYPRDDATRNTLMNKERKRKRDEQCRVRVITHSEPKERRWIARIHAEIRRNKRSREKNKGKKERNAKENTGTIEETRVSTS